MKLPIRLFMRDHRFDSMIHYTYPTQRTPKRLSKDNKKETRRHLPSSLKKSGFSIKALLPPVDGEIMP